MGNGPKLDRGKNGKKNGRAPKIRKKIQKKYENGPKMTVSVFFLCIFFVFSGPDPEWGISSFFSTFFRISGREGFLSSIPGTRNRKSRPLFLQAPPRTYTMKTPGCDRQLDKLQRGPRKGNRGPVRGTDGPVAGTEGL